MSDYLTNLDKVVRQAADILTQLEHANGDAFILMALHNVPSPEGMESEVVSSRHNVITLCSDWTRAPHLLNLGLNEYEIYLADHFTGDLDDDDESS